MRSLLGAGGRMRNHQCANPRGSSVPVLEAAEKRVDKVNRPKSRCYIQISRPSADFVREFLRQAVVSSS